MRTFCILLILKLSEFEIGGNRRKKRKISDQNKIQDFS